VRGEWCFPRTGGVSHGVAGVVGVCVAVGALLTASGGATPAAPPPGPVAAVRPADGVVPVALALPARGLTAPVVPAVTGPDGALVLPEAPSVVGWWTPGALAGALTGTAVVAGHVDTAEAGPGALAVLREVEVGEPVVLRGADGRAVTYRVTARRQHPKVELPRDVFATGGPHRLVLVTCGGAFDRTTRHYSDNVVVHAVPA
jgi:Sortase domain